MNIYYSFALPTVNHLQLKVSIMQDKPSYKKTVKRLVAYVDNEPVGTVDVIITDETIEIDSFGVIEQFQRQGIGSTIQAYIGNLANERPVILVADGEDTAKDMYTKQGYMYQSFVYHIVKKKLIK